METYLYKYDLYYKLYHTFGEIPQCLQNEYFLSKEDKEEHAICDPVSHFKKRFFDGQLDVLIPFDANYSIIYCRDWLYNQKDLDKCNIYFVSLNAGPKAETAVYYSYIPLNDTKISIWYLKANNIEEALKEFSEISFLDKKLILSNYGLLANNNLLSDVINNYNNLSISKNDL